MQYEGQSAMSELRYRSRNQPKMEVFGTDILRTSRHHLSGRPRPKVKNFGWAVEAPPKTSVMGADIYDQKPRMSMNPGLKKIQSKELRAVSSFLIEHFLHTVSQPCDAPRLAEGPNSLQNSNMTWPAEPALQTQNPGTSDNETGTYRSSQNYYRQSCYSWEFISRKLPPNYRPQSHLN